MAFHNDLGKKGESIAVEYLQNEKSFDIKELNFRVGHEEADIIAQDKNELVVVEVKTRSSTYLSNPNKLIQKTKQKSLIKLANAYVKMHDVDLDVRFDVITIITNAKGTTVEHISDAFYPTL